MAQFQNGLDIGPCRLLIGTTVIGDTLGGIKIQHSLETKETKTDQKGRVGKYVLDAIVTGVGALTQATLADLAVMFPWLDIDSHDTRLSFNSPIGTDLRDYAALATFKPIVNGVVSVTEGDWIRIPCAVFEPDIDLPMTTEDQKVFGFKFAGYPILAADIASGGHLYPNTETWAAGESMVWGD
jgi:hypothetical protein